MDKEQKRRIAYNALVMMIALAILLFITRLWPILLLVILGIFGAMLRLLYLSMDQEEKMKTDTIKPEPIHIIPSPTETEQDLIRCAYGIIEKRITERVLSQYPHARWIWAESYTRQMIAEGRQVSILLNRAGGYRKARVIIENLQFIGLEYETVQQISEQNTVSEEKTEQNCELQAFEWLNEHMAILNERSNEAIVSGKDMMIIFADELPRREAWQDICVGLVENGFLDAYITPEGIQVLLPQ